MHNVMRIGLVFALFLGSKTQAQVQFVENKGQWHPKASYRAELANGHLWLTDSGMLFSFWDAEAAEKMHERSANSFQINRHAFYLHFQNGNFSQIEQVGAPSETYYNYFKGSDRSKWVSGVHAHGEVLVKELYPGVDLRIFSSAGTLKYNLECSDAGKLSQIVMQYIGTDGVSLRDGKLQVSTSLGDFVETLPYAYALSKGIETPLNAGYSLANDEIRFQLSGESAKAEGRIIIDPILVFSTYSGSTADNFGCTGTYDDLGNGFAGGTVFSIGLPLTTGAFQTTFGGGPDEGLGYGDGRDAAILKFSSDGKQLIFGTYLGGSSNEQPHSMVAKANGDIYVMGSTRSKNFPITVDAYDNSQNGDYDFFVSLIKSDGKQLLASTYFGGVGLDAVGADRENNRIDDYPLLYNYADEFRGEIITDESNVYISGTTYSYNCPRSDNSGWFGGKEDACLFSLSGDLKTLNWSQLVGRANHDAFYGVAFGKHGDIYASGGTSSPDLPSGFSKFRNTYLGGMADGFVCRFNKLTGAMISASYVGTTSYEQAYFVQTDNSGNPYLFGQTEGAFPIVNSPFNQPGTGQFIVRLDSLLGATTLSTSFGANGNSPNISPSAFLVDQCERIFISGWGGPAVNNYLYDEVAKKVKDHRNIGNTRNLPLTADARQKNTDANDFYVAVFAKNMYSLLYATYFGGYTTSSNDAHEHVDGGTSRFDKKGIIYQAVCAGCGSNNLFPTTPGAYSRTNNSANCNNALFKIDFENLNKKPVMPDTFIELVATEQFIFDLLANDPDPQDPVYLKVIWVKKGGAAGADTPIYTIVPGIGKASINVRWTTGCKSWSEDTLELLVMVFDKGCPKADTTYSTIKILVKEPPKVIPPDAICVSFDRKTKDLKISWPQSTQSAKFFQYFLLERENPDGSVQTMDTIRNTDSGSFIDKQLNDPEKNNYCYYLIGYNICGTKVIAKDKYCSVRELTDPINTVRLRFATVENDQHVLVAWEKSDEPDFKEYEVYRYPRGGAMGQEPFAYISGESFVDGSFNVDNESYCYRIIVTDQCGHYSEPTNEGCNVIITGSATGKPLYFFDLNWQDYYGWKGGVKEWELERQYKYNPWSFVENTGINRFGRDDNLDFDWGGYYYRVTATEQAKGMAHSPEKSQSNWTYLYQPPEVYVPSGITINGDRLNDVWGTVPVFVKDYNMKIYNRWGEKVWESADKYRQWDGFVEAMQAEDGVFAWYVVFTGWDSKTYRITGTVTILH